MPAVVCVKCQRFFRPKKNGVVWEEGKPWETGKEPFREEGWSSYKLWKADLWSCPGCGTEIITGHAQMPFAEHYQPDYAEARSAYPVHTFVRDCL